MTSEARNEDSPPTHCSQLYRCYAEACDYLLEDLGNDAWLTGCPLCGGQCWTDVPRERRDEIDAMLNTNTPMK